MLLVSFILWISFLSFENLQLFIGYIKLFHNQASNQLQSFFFIVINLIVQLNKLSQ